jgi:putative flavoprotein involved in K+ transport
MTLDVMVIGAGQAGLAAGYFLPRPGVHFSLFDRAHRVGESWRHRYDSLVLFGTRAYSALPGLQMSGDPDGYPGKDEVADYLEQYAQAFDLPVALGQAIERLERRRDAFVATTERGREISSRAVIVATGPFQQCVVPSFASRLSPRVRQLTAASYRNPTQVPGERAVVVGGGATGRQIANELTTTHRVSLSVGRSPSITPQRVLGRDVMVWFDRLGFLRADKDTLKGRFARAHDSFPGRHLRSGALRRRGIRIRPRTVNADGDSCVFADGTSEVCDTVIWAVGYADDSSWLRIPDAVDSAGRYVEDHGVSRVPGLFHVGRSWQSCRVSALLCGVGDDAARIVAQAVEFICRRSDEPEPALATAGGLRSGRLNGP